MREDILEKLHKIEAKKIIYNIHYCRAGVGFIFYDPEIVKEPEITKKVKIGNKEIDTKTPLNWETGLVVNKYYPTFEKAVEEEYNLLTP